MTDNDFKEIILTTITAIILDAETSGEINLPNPVKTEAGNQPRQQGQAENPMAFYNIIGTKNYGWQSRKDEFNDGDDDFDHTERQWKERTVQIGVEITENPADDTLSTATDVVNCINMGFGSEKIFLSLKSQGVGIIRITDVREPYIQDEHDRYTMQPNFDCVFSYLLTKQSKVEKLEAIEGNTQAI